MVREALRLNQPASHDSMIHDSMIHDFDDSRFDISDSRFSSHPVLFNLLAVKIRVSVVEPVLTNGTEQIELERVIERFRLVFDP